MNRTRSRAAPRLAVRRSADLPCRSVAGAVADPSAMAVPGAPCDAILAAAGRRKARTFPGGDAFGGCEIRKACLASVGLAGSPAHVGWLPKSLGEGLGADSRWRKE